MHNRGVGAKLTGEPAGWMIFRHFLWNTAPPFHGTAAIQLWAVYQSDELWSAAGEVAGRVLYDRGRGDLLGALPLSGGGYLPYGYQGIYGQRDIFGTFSLSTAAQHGRGYVVYAADEIPHAEYRNVLDSRFHYSYPHRFLQYPAKTALENRMSDHGAFRTVWSDLRYGPEVTPPVIKKRTINGMTLRQKPEGHSDIFHSIACRPATGAEQKFGNSRFIE